MSPFKSPKGCFEVTQQRHPRVTPRVTPRLLILRLSVCAVCGRPAQTRPRPVWGRSHLPDRPPRPRGRRGRPPVAARPPGAPAGCLRRRAALPALAPSLVFILLSPNEVSCLHSTQSMQRICFARRNAIHVIIVMCPAPPRPAPQAAPRSLETPIGTQALQHWQVPVSQHALRRRPAARAGGSRPFASSFFARFIYTPTLCGFRAAGRARARRGRRCAAGVLALPWLVHMSICGLACGSCRPQPGAVPACPAA